jgi:KaiC/GvpD/RAD55 family RecA-like ATPase
MGNVKSAIPGLDELIEGGYVENDVILITGGPGAGDHFWHTVPCRGSHSL